MARPVYLNEVLYKPQVSSPSIPAITQKPRASQVARGVEWFYFLVPSPGHSSLEDAYPNYKSMFLVCGHFPKSDGQSTKMFAAFNTYLDFINYIKDVPRERWNFFEIIIGSKPHKFYIDIDLKADYIPVGDNLESFTRRLLEILFDRIIYVFTQYLNVNFDLTRNLLLFSSHGPGKKSFPCDSRRILCYE